MIKLFLFDIEGTTTDINFVHKVLFPYSKKNLSSFMLEHQNDPAVRKAIEDVKRGVRGVLPQQGSHVGDRGPDARQVLDNLKTHRQRLGQFLQEPSPPVG